MLASLGAVRLDDPQLLYELKYDGIRAIAEVSPARGGEVHLWSRLGNEKTSEFPAIAAALAQWGRGLKARVILDGEIVALDARGNPAGFQQLQRRSGGRVAFIAFDLLRQGAVDLRGRPLLARRAALERLFTRVTGGRQAVLRLSEMVRGDGCALYARALKDGWEGLIAKHTGSLYKAGKRTPDWRKVKIVQEQEFVIGGWTEPRQSRSHFGALLLGVYARGRLVYVGHAGTGFDERQLERLMALMKPVETDVCPFDEPPPANERPHWTKPELVAQVKFSEWTAEGILRHPVFLGLREDKPAKDVRRESAAPRVPGSRLEVPEPRTRNPEPGTRNLIEQLQALEESRRDGVIDAGGGNHLAVTNLHKVFWPRQKLTKGDLLRYYVQVAPFILPVVADRALVMKRFPNGIAAEPFYQHRAVEPPSGVRVETIHAPGADGPRPQMVGGGLTTLLYMAQLAAISQDPWFSRVQSPDDADHAALDLDPMPGVPFARVLDVARWIRDELEALGAPGFPKTSGADGLHVYVPLPAGTPYQAGLLFCQIVATVVVQKHPKVATIERSVKKRGNRVYVDCLQNILGKTLAAAYSARASDYAGVSTPLTWAEVDEGVDREAFTITSVPGRLRRAGDLWEKLRRSKGVDFAKTCGIS